MSKHVRTPFWILSTALILFASCAAKQRHLGLFSDKSFKDSRFFNSLTIYPDGTAVYTWWADIRVTDKGTWTVSNDTLFFREPHAFNLPKIFIIKKRKLIEAKSGTEYKKRGQVSDLQGRINPSK